MALIIVYNFKRFILAIIYTILLQYGQRKIVRKYTEENSYANAGSLCRSNKSLSFDPIIRNVTICRRKQQISKTGKRLLSFLKSL